MPEAPLQRDFSRRRTPQDRPFVWSGDSVRNLVPRVQETDCPTHCAQECLQRGPVTFLGQPAAYRFAFDFDSSHAFYSEFAGTVILTWDEAGAWYSDEIEVTCPGDASPSTFVWVLQSPQSSLAAGEVQLLLQKLSGDDCESHAHGAYLWQNEFTFDPLCPNQFRPGSGTDPLVNTATRAHMAIYDGTQSCLICVEPFLSTVLVDFSCIESCDDETPETWPEIEVPSRYLIALPALTADGSSADCCDMANLGPDVILENAAGNEPTCDDPLGSPSSPSYNPCGWSHGTEARLECLEGSEYVLSCMWLDLRCVDGDTYYMRLQFWLRRINSSPNQSQLATYLSETFTAAEAEEFLMGFDVTQDSLTGDSICADIPASFAVIPI